jgi:hypothetical protein
VDDSWLIEVLDAGETGRLLVWGTTPPPFSKWRTVVLTERSIYVIDAPPEGGGIRRVVGKHAIGDVDVRFSGKYLYVGRSTIEIDEHLRSRARKVADVVAAARSSRLSAVPDSARPARATPIGLILFRIPGVIAGLGTIFTLVWAGGTTAGLSASELFESAPALVMPLSMAVIAISLIHRPYRGTLRRRAVLGMPIAGVLGGSLAIWGKGKLNGVGITGTALVFMGCLAALVMDARAPRLPSDVAEGLGPEDVLDV